MSSTTLPIGQPQGGAGAPSVFSLGGYWQGQLPATTDPIQRLLVARPVLLQAGTVVTALCGVAPSGNVTLPLKVGGATIGSIAFLSGYTVGTVTFPTRQAIFA